MTNPQHGHDPHRTLEYIQSLRKSTLLGPHVIAYKCIESQSIQSCAIADMINSRLRTALKALGIEKLYSHQISAIEAIRSGRHVIVSTPTASGKSLIYNLSLFEAFNADPDSNSLYIFPLKALTRDQLKGFQAWSGAFGEPAPNGAVYDGDTSDYHRRKIRQNPPNALMTNPEMLHLALLPHHAKWGPFFRSLKLVVVDEAHTYRGLLGSHMAQVLRRLRRICQFYQASPTFVLASATIGNPGYLARELTGLEVQTIEKSGAAQGARHMVLMDPPDGPAQTAISLLKAAMARRLRTIVYTQSRKMAELISLWVRQRSGRFAEQVSVYRAGLLPDDRRKIESDLQKGKLLAVVSTSALELGIDIGDLELCVLVGYPGSITASLQRSGRVGRNGQPSAVIMLAGQDALDQYFVSNPHAFFSGMPESAVINPWNQVVLRAHLECAAAELPIAKDEAWWDENQVMKTTDQMEREGQLLRSADGKYIYARRKRPHFKVHLRATGQRFNLLSSGKVIGEVNDFRLYRETHPGAIYLHKGATYAVKKVDEQGKCVYLEPANEAYYTRIRSETDVEIVETEEYKYYGNTRCCIGLVKVTDMVTGYLKIDARSGRSTAQIDLDVPPTVFNTQSVWFELDFADCRRVSDRGHDLLGALHAAEHAAIGIMPLAVLADRNDIGGLSTPFHPQTNSAVIFIYDGIPGGAGLSHEAYRQSDMLLKRTADAINRCDCEKGCPACVHSPKCGSGNRPIDKYGASYLLHLIQQNTSRPLSRAMPKTPKRRPSASEPKSSNWHYGVFDLETQKSAKEVGGWHNAHRMRVSCGVVYDSQKELCSVYMEDQIDDLIEHLTQFDRVVGFNSKRFDYKVLSGYSDIDFTQLPSIDLLELVHGQLGFRLSLDHLAEHTLGMKKSGSGLDALRWWQAGKVRKIVEYCKKDVEITRDIFIFARENGFLVYRRKSGERIRIPILLNLERVGFP